MRFKASRFGTQPGLIIDWRCLFCRQDGAVVASPHDVAMRGVEDAALFRVRQAHCCDGSVTWTIRNPDALPAESPR